MPRRKPLFIPYTTACTSLLVHVPTVQCRVPFQPTPTSRTAIHTLHTLHYSFPLTHYLWICFTHFFSPLTNCCMDRRRRRRGNRTRSSVPHCGIRRVGWEVVGQLIHPHSKVFRRQCFCSHFALGLSTNFVGSMLSMGEVTLPYQNLRDSIVGRRICKVPPVPYTKVPDSKSLRVIF